MPNLSATDELFDRLGSAGIGVREQVTSNEFLSALDGHQFLVRGAISLSSESVARVLVLDDLPTQHRIGREISAYSQTAFLEAEVSGETFSRWCIDGIGRVDSLEFQIPQIQQWATWERQPSQAAYGLAPTRWPVLRGEVTQQQQVPARGDYYFLIQDGLPTFSSYADGLSYYLFPGMNVPIQALPSGFIIVRIADTRCWIDRMHFAPAHVSISLKGREVPGAKVQLIGPQSWQEKTAGPSGRVKIALPRGIDPQQMLVVAKGTTWLDYRYLGRSAFESQPGVTFEAPDQCTQIAILATQGEQQLVEYKSQLPATDGERAKLARTVVGFANSQGGHLIYGVDREGAIGTQIVGVHYSADLADTLVRIVRDRVEPDPGVEIVDCEVEGKHLVAVVVRNRPNRFFALNTAPPEFYIRRQANTFPASLAEIRELAATLVERPQTSVLRRR
jgi:hypothetical protein